MMWQGIAAEGAIDIKSSVLTGSIKTASAGLFIDFLSFAVIVFALSSLTKKPLSAQPQSPRDHTKSKRVLILLAWLFPTFLVTVSLAALGYGNAFAGAAAFLGVMLLIGGIVYLTFLEGE